MSYTYAAYREWLASDEGIDAVGSVVRKVERVLKPAGAALMNNLLPDRCADSWAAMAAVDHVVRLGIIREVMQDRVPAGQHRVFVAVDL